MRILLLAILLTGCATPLPVVTLPLDISPAITEALVQAHSPEMNAAIKAAQPGVPRAPM